MKKSYVIIIILSLFLAGIVGYGLGKQALSKPEEPVVKKEETFEHWNQDSPALKQLIDYVEDVTDENSENFIPAVDRVATFDMDGTLMAELCPTYIGVKMLMERIFNDPSYEADEEMREFGLMMRDHAMDKSFPSDFDYTFSSHEAKAFAGMSLNEYSDYVTGFLLNDADGFENMIYGNAYYLPMVEVIDYLQDHDFKCFIVTGSDRFFIRTFIEGVIDVPYENIIGSDVELEAKDQGDTENYVYEFTGKDTLVRTDKLIIKNIKTSKVLQIAQEIDRKPVLSFGNSSGDVSMHNYTITNNGYKSAAFQLIADDDVRDYGNSSKGKELRDKWEGMGFVAVSMKNDWKTIYGENVVKTGSFHWLEDYADE